MKVIDSPKNIFNSLVQSEDINRVNEYNKYNPYDKIIISSSSKPWEFKPKIIDKIIFILTGYIDYNKYCLFSKTINIDWE